VTFERRIITQYFSRAIPSVTCPAVCFYTVIDAAAAMETSVKNWKSMRLVIRVDVDRCRVSFQQGYCCIVVSPRGRSHIKVVQAHALPSTFVTVQLARQVTPSSSSSSTTTTTTEVIFM
jgi:hypothetical protein